MAEQPAGAPGEETQGGARLRIKPPDAGEVPSLYANYASVNLSPHDFTLRFGQYSMPDEPNIVDGEMLVPATPVTTVTIPLTLVMSLARTLERQAAQWEEAFGQPLPTQPGEQPERAS